MTGAGEQTPKPRRRSGSFVLKLTASQSLRMFRLMLVVDLLVAALFAGLLLTELEHVVAGWEDLGADAAAASEPLPGRTFSREPEAEPGFTLYPLVERMIRVRPGWVRGISFPSAPGEAFLLKNWEVRAVYTISAPLEGGDYLVAAFDVSTPVRRFCYGMAGLLVVELVMLITHTAGAARGIRRTLAPIQQLAAATRSISSGAGVEKPIHRKKEKEPQPLKLSGTIDTLNKITAGHLDTRIPLEGERAELRGLAAAINGMLDRVDAAYSSQMRFVSDASHELRTPIAVLQGYANMLDRWGKDDPAVLEESIEAIKAESEGMKVLVEQLLFLARGDNNSIVMQVHPLEASDLAAEVLRDAQLIHRERRFESDLDAALWVEGDAGLLKQAMRIFVDNAVKYSPAGGKVKIAAHAEEGWAKISVTDNGIGIPEEDLPHVLERFFRSDESRARATGGTGLGLSIAQWIVERHGGHLEILSREELGTRLTMALPIAEAPLDAEDGEDAV